MDCYVCLERCLPDERVFTCPCCSGVLHEDCHTELLANHSRCGLCRCRLDRPCVSLFDVPVFSKYSANVVEKRTNISFDEFRLFCETADRKKMFVGVVSYYYSERKVGTPIKEVGMPIHDGSGRRIKILSVVSNEKTKNRSMSNYYRCQRFDVYMIDNEREYARLKALSMTLALSMLF